MSAALAAPDRAIFAGSRWAASEPGGTMTPATVVLVHGMGGSPDAWSRVIPLLDRLGIPNIAVELPSCLPESAMNDVAGLQSVLDECIDPVVLVGHSNGGVVVT